jgi:NAD(P)-dependent dehydrogenase (short-subunit alcohol dehydrogenase family)
MISEGFVANGATVYVSSRDAAACAQACDEMNKLGKGGRAAYIAADLYKEEDLERIRKELEEREGSEFFSCFSFFWLLLAFLCLMGTTAKKTQNSTSSSTTAAATGAPPTPRTPRQPGTASSH